MFGGPACEPATATIGPQQHPGMRTLRRLPFTLNVANNAKHASISYLMNAFVHDIVMPPVFTFKQRLLEECKNAPSPECECSTAKAPTYPLALWRHSSFAVRRGCDGMTPGEGLRAA